MKSPSPPDPYKTAAAQQAAEMGASWTSGIINNPNQVSPWGTSNYSVAGYETVKDAKGKDVQVPRYTQTVKLSPEQQKLYDLSSQTQANLGQTGVEQSQKLQSYLGQNADFSGVTDWSQSPQGQQVRQDQDPTDRRSVEAAMMSRYREGADKQAKAQDAQLSARGMNPGSSQYSTVNDSRARADTDAQMQAFLASGNEARAAQGAYNQAGGQQFAQDSAAAQFQNQLRQAQTQDIFARRNQPLNEISALLSGSQVTAPQFNPFSAQGVNAAPIGSYIQSNYQQQANNANAFNSGLFNLAGAGLGGLMGGFKWG